MPPPAVIEPIMQKTGMDCVIACLAMVLAIPYVDAAKAAQEVDPLALQLGLTITEAKRVARKLGRKMTTMPVFDEDEATGILYVRKGTRGKYHAVVMFGGVIYNPADGLLYQYDTYMATEGVKPYKLLVV